LIAGLALSACAPLAPTTAPTSIPPTAAPATAAPTSVPATAAQSGEVRFMVFGEPAEVEAFDKVAEAFEEANPGVKVSLVPVPGTEEEYHARLASELVAGSPADVVLIDYDAAAEFYEKGGLQPLTDQLAASTVVKPADLYPQALQAFQNEGQQMCLPLSISSLVVFFNKDKFDEAGQAYPTAGWTWDQFLATAQALTKDENGDGVPEEFGVAIEPKLNNILPFIWQNGGEFLAEGNHALAIDTPEAKAAIQFVLDWQSKYHIAPDEEHTTSEGARELFQHGELAMLIQSSEFAPEAAEMTGLNWDIGPLPQKAQAANILKSDGVCLPAKAANPELGWKLIEFLLSPEGQRIMGAAGRIVPVNKSVAESTGFLDPSAKPASRQVWLDNIPLIRTVPPLENWPDIEERANEELEHAYFGHATAEEAIEEIIQQTRPYLES
jgi:multiple sugar transport system substrate-binding protein